MCPKKALIDTSRMYCGASSIVMERAKVLRQRMTASESTLWEELRLKKLGVKFRRQHPIAKYIVDFYCHQLRLSIEVDGGYHLSKQQTLLDQQRSVHLKDIGLIEMRFTNDEVDQNLAQVVASIRERIEQLQNEQ